MIHATELMIGDWVDVLAHFLEVHENVSATYGEHKLCHKACRIGGIDGDSIAIDKICADMISFEPIPLTEEILKANGFEKVSSVDYKLPYAESLAERGFYLENRVSGLYMITDHQLMPIVYVHELQRVLRCCGLWNLANNLKV